MHKKSRKNSHILLHHPIPQAGTAQSQQGTSQLERGPLAREGKAGWATSFSSISGHLSGQRSCFSFLQPRQAKLRHREMAMNKRAEQGFWEHSPVGVSGLTGTYSADEPRSFHHWRRNQWWAQLSQTPCIFPQPLPHRYPHPFTDASHLNPSPPTGAQELRQQPFQASVASQVQDASLNPTPDPSAVYGLRTSPCSCVLAHHRPDAHHQPPVHCARPEKIVQQQENKPTARVPVAASGPRPAPVFCPWPALPRSPVATPSSCTSACSQTDAHHYHWNPLHLVGGQILKPQESTSTASAPTAATEPAVSPGPCRLHGS